MTFDETHFWQLPFHKQVTQPSIPLNRDNANRRPPSSIGRFKIHRLLAEGGSSSLYLATACDFSHPVVIKALNPHRLYSSQLLACFLQEASLINLPPHPNLVRLYEHGVWENGYYIVMELIRGTLLRLYAKNNWISLQGAVPLFLGIARAVAHLHSHQIIHRDLKPENIVITDTGMARVIDFGVSQLCRPLAVGADEQEHGWIVGTLNYMSPEQKRGTAPLSAATDIYSLGVIFYELLVPGEFLGLLDLQKVPAIFRDVVKKATALEPAERFSSVESMMKEIEHLACLQERQVLEWRPKQREPARALGLERWKWIASLDESIAVSYQPLGWDSHRCASLLFSAAGSLAEQIAIQSALGATVRLLNRLERSPILLDYLAKVVYNLLQDFDAERFGCSLLETVDQSVYYVRYSHSPLFYSHKSSKRVWKAVQTTLGKSDLGLQESHYDIEDGDLLCLHAMAHTPPPPIDNETDIETAARRWLALHHREGAPQFFYWFSSS